MMEQTKATTDAPTALFADDLLAAYPDAKVVLNTRDADAWLASMESSYYEVMGWRSWPLLCYFDPVSLLPPFPHYTQSPKYGSDKRESGHRYEYTVEVK